MKLLRAFCAAIILTMPMLVRAQGMVWPASPGIANYAGSDAWGTSYSASNRIPGNFLPTTAVQTIAPSGDVTGVTDGAAINAALSAGYSAQLACNSTYYTNVPIQVPASASFIGCGYSTEIEGVGSISGGVVELLQASLDQWAAQLVGNFQIIGGTATEAVLAGSQTAGVGPYIGVHIFNIEVRGGTYTNEFWFSSFFNNQVDNLIAGGGTVSEACFHFDGAVNADVFSNLSATCGAPYGAYMQNTVEASGSSGDTFNTLNIEGGCSSGTTATCAGLYIGNQYNAITINGLYTESVLFPVVLGNAAANKFCGAITFNSPVIGGTASVNADETALVDIEDCVGVTFNAPSFAMYGLQTSAPLTFTGGGCTTEPEGVGIPSPAGQLVIATLVYPGAGCTGAPSVSVGGAGSGAGVTAAESGGIVTGLTINAPGSGYVLVTQPPLIYTDPSKVTLNDPYCFDGSGGYRNPCWWWIVRSSSSTGGIQITGDSFYIPNVALVPADLEPTGINNQHWLKYIDASGASESFSFVPGVFP